MFLGNKCLKLSVILVSLAIIFLFGITSISAADNSPTVVSVDPVNGAVNVTGNKMITLNFSESIQAGSAYNNIKVTDSDDSSKSISKAIKGNQLTITPNSPWEYGMEYTIYIPKNSVKDLAGRNLKNSFTSEFTVTSQSCSDPIINGTININEFGHIRPLPNAIVTVNSTSNRTLATTKTDENGYYYLNFYSTDSQFRLTASYMGCNPITNVVTVTSGPDGNYYGTSNFQLTPIQAQFTSLGSNGASIWVHGDDMYAWAGEINVRSPPGTGSNYIAFCIDLYTMIYTGDTLLVSGPLPGTTGNFSEFLLNGVDWGKVNYIINNYHSVNATEAAAAQCAIWYLTSAPYGPYPGGNDPLYPAYYQFLTYNSTYGTPYDGYSSAYGGYIVQRAWQMINSAISMLYPATISVQPEITNAQNGQNVMVTATVKDQYGNPLPNINVNFTKNAGNLSVTSGLTNSSGQISTILSGVTGNSTANVMATVTGNYGNLLYDDQYNPGNKKQNLVAINLLPNVVSATSIINFNIQSNVQLNQTVNGGSSATVNVGDPLTFVITARCTGPYPATGLMIRDIFPPRFVVTSATPSVGAYSNGVWVIPFLANGTTATLTITGSASSAMAGNTTNNTAVRFFQNENDPQPDTAVVTVYTKKADVVLSQTGNYSGETVTFIVTAANNGPDTATNINIRDLIPSRLTGVTINPSIGTYNPITGIWYIGSLLNGSSATLNITGNATPQSTVNNSATWISQTEYNSRPNNVTTSVYVPLVDIYVFNDPWVYLTKEQKYQDTYSYGNVPVFIWGVYNSFDYDEATGVISQYIIPSGFQFITANNDIGSVSYAYNSTSQQGILTWNIGYMPKDAFAFCYVYVKVVQTGHKTENLTTVADLIHADQDIVDPFNNQNITCGITVPESADVQVNQTYVKNGSQVVYKITVTNNGPSNATGVQINDILPDDLRYISSNPSQGIYNPDTGLWDIGTIDDGDIKTLTITSQITGKGTIINTAMENSQDQDDWNYDNNAQTTYLIIS